MDILEHFPFDSDLLPDRYLGLPLMTKRMTMNNYTPMLEWIRKRLTSWTTRQLLFAGRLQLIGSVIHSIKNFWMSAFGIPRQCVKEIDNLCSEFLWSGPELNPRKAKFAWSEVCKPINEGGRGLKSLTEANTVCFLKLKLIWRILSSRTVLWVKWIERYLIRKGSLWSVSERILYVEEIIEVTSSRGNSY